MCFPALAAAIPAALGGAGAAAGAATGIGTALSVLSTGAALVGTGLSVAGQIQQGKAAQAAAESDAKWKTALAADAVQRGQSEAMEARRKTRAIIGGQKATLAAGGLDIQSGSPLDILGDTAAVGELDALTIENNAEREASSLRQGAAISRAEGQSARSGAMIGAFGTALGGLATVSDKWYRSRSARLA